MPALRLLPGPDADLPELPGQEHDYDPEWDYAVAGAPDGAWGRTVEEVAAEISERVLPDMGFQSALAFFVEQGSLDGDVGRYVDGTASCPYIAVDAELIVSRAGPAGFRDEIMLTVLHELAHAWIEARMEDGAMPLEAEEEAVEAFARAYVDEGRIAIAELEAGMQSAKP